MSSGYLAPQDSNNTNLSSNLGVRKYYEIRYDKDDNDKNSKCESCTTTSNDEIKSNRVCFFYQHDDDQPTPAFVDTQDLINYLIHFKSEVPDKDTPKDTHADSPIREQDVILPESESLEKSKSKQDLGDYKKEPEKKSRLDWQDYYRLQDIHDFLDDLESHHPSICSTSVIGYSVEQRELKILKISNSNSSNARVWIDAGIHAREWIAPAVNTYIANYIAQNFDNLPLSCKNKDWYFLPVVNPDGYEYSHTTNRMWRKNRARINLHSYGVDLNRNFSFGWGGIRSSREADSTLYRGKSPFSEPESCAIRDFLSQRGQKFTVYITLHSYGQIILFPFAYRDALAPDYISLLEGATVMSKAIFRTSGKIYKIGISRDVMYGASGTSSDWSHGVAGIPFCYLIELRSKEHKFKLPKNQIEATCIEILNCIMALLEFIDKSKPDKSGNDKPNNVKSNNGNSNDGNFKTDHENIKPNNLKSDIGNSCNSNLDKSKHVYVKTLNENSCSSNLENGNLENLKSDNGNSTVDNSDNYKPINIKTDNENSYNSNFDSRKPINLKSDNGNSYNSNLDNSKPNNVDTGNSNSDENNSDNSKSIYVNFDNNNLYSSSLDNSKPNNVMTDNDNVDNSKYVNVNIHNDNFDSKNIDYSKPNNVKTDNDYSDSGNPDNSNSENDNAEYDNVDNFKSSNGKSDNSKSDNSIIDQLLSPTATDLYNGSDATSYTESSQNSSVCLINEITVSEYIIKVASISDKTQVWEVVVSDDEQRRYVKSLDTKGLINIWKEEFSTMDIMVEGPRAGQVVGLLHDKDIVYSIAVPDVLHLLEKEKEVSKSVRRRSSTTKGATMDWNNYHRLDTIYAWMDNLAAEYPYLVQVKVIGKSVEGRDLKILIISNGDEGNVGVWIDGCIHAREWVSVAAVTYVADRIVRTFHEQPESVTNKRWYLLPVLNPDGYEYTHTHDRMWRKNRARYGECVGVDLNRNFSVGWGEKDEEGSSDDPGSIFYRGPNPFSEPETEAVKNAIINSDMEFKAFLSFHSYGEVIIFPWGYTTDACPDYVNLLEGGTNIAKAIYRTHGHTYRVGSTKDLMYYAAGTSTDWSYGAANILYSYMFELRGKKHRFLLPKEQIMETASEVLNGVLQLMDFIDGKCSMENCCGKR